MKKPLTIKKYEFDKNLEHIINESGLPAFIIESSLKDFIATIKVMADNQLKEDCKEFKAAVERESAQNVSE